MSGGETSFLPMKRKAPQSAAGTKRSKAYRQLSEVLPDLIQQLSHKDREGFFQQRVDESIAPGYYTIITKPMDFNTIREKFSRDEYQDLEALKADVIQICINATTYNAPETIWYKAAKKLQAQCIKTIDSIAKHVHPDEVRRAPDPLPPRRPHTMAAAAPVPGAPHQSLPPGVRPLAQTPGMPGGANNPLMRTKRKYVKSGRYRRTTEVAAPVALHYTTTSRRVGGSNTLSCVEVPYRLFAPKYEAEDTHKYAVPKGTPTKELDDLYKTFGDDVRAYCDSIQRFTAGLGPEAEAQAQALIFGLTEGMLGGVPDPAQDGRLVNVRKGQRAKHHEEAVAAHHRELTEADALREASVHVVADFQRVDPSTGVDVLSPDDAALLKTMSDKCPTAFSFLYPPPPRPPAPAAPRTMVSPARTATAPVATTPTPAAALPGVPGQLPGAPRTTLATPLPGAPTANAAAAAAMQQRQKLIQQQQLAAQQRQNAAVARPGVAGMAHQPLPGMGGIPGVAHAPLPGMGVHVMPGVGQTQLPGTALAPGGVMRTGLPVQPGMGIRTDGLMVGLPQAGRGMAIPAHVMGGQLPGVPMQAVGGMAGMSLPAATQGATR